MNGKSTYTESEIPFPIYGILAETPHGESFAVTFQRRWK